jgi:DNA-binding transcriptional regulator YdaS (Cro superfamily)
MRLSSWLLDQGLSHSAFARLVGGVSAEAVRLWAGGMRMPGTEHVERIAELTGGAVTVSDLHDARVEKITSKRK